MSRRQIFDLGDCIAVLQPDADGNASVCIMEPGGRGTGAGVAQEIWIFGKPHIRILGELALAAQQFKEDAAAIRSLAVMDILPEPINPLDRGIDTDGEAG